MTILSVLFAWIECFIVRGNPDGLPPRLEIQYIYFIYTDATVLTLTCKNWCVLFKPDIGVYVLFST